MSNQAAWLKELAANETAVARIVSGSRIEIRGWFRLGRRWEVTVHEIES